MADDDKQGAGDAGNEGEKVQNLAQDGAKGAAGAEGAGKGDGASAGQDGGERGESGPKWPDNWREQIAGDDAKALKQLGRYASPEDIWKKARQFETRLSSGELRSALPKEATDEDVAAWRKENGIPEAPAGYDLGDMKIAEEDRPIVDGFLASAHAVNATPEQAKALVGWYYAEYERQAQEQEERDAQAKDAVDAALRDEWGGNFRREMNMVNGLLAQAPEAVQNDLMAGRMPDGTPIGSSPEVLKWLASLAHEMNPAGTLVPNTGGDTLKSVESRIEEIEGFMRSNRREYNRNEKMQAELRELYGAREKLKERAA